MRLMNKHFNYIYIIFFNFKRIVGKNPKRILDKFLKITDIKKK